MFKRHPFRVFDALKPKYNISHTAGRRKKTTKNGYCPEFAQNLGMCSKDTHLRFSMPWNQNTIYHIPRVSEKRLPKRVLSRICTKSWHVFKRHPFRVFDALEPKYNISHTAGKRKKTTKNGYCPEFAQNLGMCSKDTRLGFLMPWNQNTIYRIPRVSEKRLPKKGIVQNLHKILACVQKTPV